MASLALNLDYDSSIWAEALPSKLFNPPSPFTISTLLGIITTGLIDSEESITAHVIPLANLTYAIPFARNYLVNLRARADPNGRLESEIIVREMAVLKMEVKLRNMVSRIEFAESLKARFGLLMRLAEGVLRDQAAAGLERAVGELENAEGKINPHVSLIKVKDKEEVKARQSAIVSKSSPVKEEDEIKVGPKSEPHPKSSTGFRLIKEKDDIVSIVNAKEHASARAAMGLRLINSAWATMYKELLTARELVAEDEKIAVQFVVRFELTGEDGGKSRFWRDVLTMRGDPRVGVTQVRTGSVRTLTGMIGERESWGEGEVD